MAAPRESKRFPFTESRISLDNQGLDTEGMLSMKSFIADSEAAHNISTPY